MQRLKPKLVYVIPNEAINQPNLFVLRRGLKEAIRKKADMVILDMDTPGGRLDFVRNDGNARFFEGATATYINQMPFPQVHLLPLPVIRFIFHPKEIWEQRQ